MCGGVCAPGGKSLMKVTTSIGPPAAGCRPGKVPRAGAGGSSARAAPGSARHGSTVRIAAVSPGCAVGSSVTSSVVRAPRGNVCGAAAGGSALVVGEDRAQRPRWRGIQVGPGRRQDAPLEPAVELVARGGELPEGAGDIRPGEVDDVEVARGSAWIAQTSLVRRRRCSLRSPSSSRRKARAASPYPGGSATRTGSGPWSPSLV